MKKVCPSCNVDGSCNLDTQPTHTPKPSCLAKECPDCWPKAQHTPTPWKVSNYRPYNLIARDPSESTYQIGDDEFQSLGEIKKADDAAFIVLAVNAHSSLLQNLKNAHTVLLVQNEFNDTHLMQEIERALALAEGK